MTSGVYQAIRLGADKRPSTGTVIAAAPDTGGGIPPAILALWVPGQVAIAWTAEHRPIRRLTADSLAQLRRKRLRRQLDRKHPLIAAQLYEQELAARPAFYAGERPG